MRYVVGSLSDTGHSDSDTGHWRGTRRGKQVNPEMGL